MNHTAILLLKLNKLLTTFGLNELQKIGITPPQLFVLRRICDTPKTIGQISKEVDLSYSTVSGIIDRLERGELVERVRDQEDRRVVWIKPATKFKEMKEKQMWIYSEELYSDLFQELSKEDLGVLERSLQTVITHLEQKVEEKP